MPPLEPETLIEPPKPKRRLWRLPLLVGLLLALLVIVVKWQPIEDWVRLRNYIPPPTIAQLASQTMMTDSAKHIFYLNKPQLLSTVTSFRKACATSESTIVLGCYHDGENGIFIYNVADPALNGVAQVTAAHEALHAIYNRLSSSVRTLLNNELESFYKTGLHDASVQAEVKLYMQTEPNSVVNEMHSLFGTEVVNLPPNLENYYKKYFSNRSVIVNYGKKYESAFTTRQATITADDQKLAALKTQINQQETTLNGELNQLNAKQTEMDNLQSSGQIDAYNADVPGYNIAVRDYNQGVDNLQNTIMAYNQLVATRNLVAGELTTLDKALDTRLTTQSTR